MLELNGNKPLPGITHSTMFISGSGAMFPWHCEEQDMGSLNYLHAPNRDIDVFKLMPVNEKIWNIVSPTQFHLFEEVVNGLILKCKDMKFDCDNWLMHRFLMLDPKILNQFGVNTWYTRQQEGEYVAVFPSTYHCGEHFKKL